MVRSFPALVAWSLAWSALASVLSRGRSRLIHSADSYLRSIGRQLKGLMMSETLEQLNLPMSMSSVEDSRARTCPPQDAARALLESARACGVSTLVSLENSTPSGSSSKTLRVARRDGSIGSCVNWNSSVMTAYLSRCRRAMSALFTCANDSLLLPTAVASTGQYNRGGGSGRVGPKRYGLTALRQSYPTLCRRDEKGPGPAHTKSGADLPQVMGGHLNPEWLLWFIGFPRDWLDVNDDAEFGRLETRLSRNARKSLGG